MRNKKSKKGFTLVELLVVIAILAVLATVSVVGYMSFTKKAQISNDESLVAQLNIALKANEATDGQPETPTEMVEVMEANGFKVENLTPTTSKYNIVWNQKDNEFALLDENNEVVYGNIADKIEDNWMFVSTYTSTEYSVYLKEGFKGNTIAVTSGLDVGENTGLKTVTYNGTDHAKSIVIRTNNSEGTLEIDAANDNVKHYGDSERINVKAVAKNSYHEFGSAKAIVVNAGRVVVENEADVKMVIASPTAEAETVSVEVAKENTTVYAPTGVDVKGTVSSGEIASSNINNAIDGVKYFDGGDGTEANPYLIANGEQAYNMKYAKGFFKLINDAVVSNEIYLSSKTVTLDLNGHKLELEYGEDAKPNNGGVLNISGKKGVLNVKDSSEKGNGQVLGSTSNYANKVTSAIRVGNYGTLNIYGGEFVGRSEGTSCIFVMTSRTSGSKATVNIYGGTFRTLTANSDGKHYVLNHQDSATTGCTITVHGGTFYDYEPGVTEVDSSNAYTGKIALANGCTTTSTKENGHTIYTVSKN